MHTIHRHNSLTHNVKQQQFTLKKFVAKILVTFCDIFQIYFPHFQSFAIFQKN